jgi:hypothetical protein
MLFTTEAQRALRKHREWDVFKPLCFLRVLCASVVRFNEPDTRLPELTTYPLNGWLDLSPHNL